MYNKSGSRNKQNKAIEKTTTEKKTQKEREKKQQKELATFLQCVLFPFLAAIVCNRRKASHAHTHHLTHTHTHTHPYSHTKTYSPTKGQCAAHYSKTRNQLQKWRQQCSMCSSQLATCCTRIVRGIHSSNTIN